LSRSAPGFRARSRGRPGGVGKRTGPGSPGRQPVLLGSGPHPGQPLFLCMSDPDPRSGHRHEVQTDEVPGRHRTRTRWMTCSTRSSWTSGP